MEDNTLVTLTLIWSNVSSHMCHAQKQSVKHGYSYTVAPVPRTFACYTSVFHLFCFVPMGNNQELFFSKEVIMVLVPILLQQNQS